MNITELIAQYRLESDDTAVPYFTSDANVTLLVNQAVEEACRRKRLLFDATTAAVCEITVTDVTATYVLHADVVFIHRAYLVNAAAEYIYLDPVDREGMERRNPTWREDTGDEPVYLIVDEGKVQLVPAPAEDYTLHLEVYRVPLAAEKIGAGTAPNVITTPAIAAMHHIYLVHWAVGQALMRPDADFYAPQKADQHLAKFDRYFGRPPDADRLREVQANRPHRNTLYR